MTFGVFFPFIERGDGRSRVNPVGYIIQESGCWEWVGAVTLGGYGKCLDGKRSRLAHRAMYERHRGPIPKGLVIDHLCRNPSCVNPDHLEVVTQRVNLLRGDSPSWKTFRSGLCIRGHQRTGMGECRACARERDRRARASRGPAPPRPAQTHCKRKHELVAENVYVFRGRRNCRACVKIRGRKYHANNS